MKVFRNIKEEGGIVKKEVFDIIECTYSGKFMGERSITATISWASPIDFQIGDYVDLEMQSLVRGSGGQHGGTLVERFYIYTMPTIKKASSVNTSSKGFEHTVTFYPAQHELASVQMRDMGSDMSADSIVYTGFDTVTFYGGAFELMERIMSVLKVAYHDENGNALWNYEIADAVNEQINTALERFPFSFSGNTVMDALLKLSDKEGINTTFYINNRTIYVGFKRPYFCRVTDGGIIDSDLSTQMFSFKYGKTSHLSQAIDHGGLYDITKTVGNQLPITKLFAYGASRNLNRYYCSDRIAGGRYVNRVMLPSFDMDGKTDYIISEDAANKYGIREASKQFEDIYPSLRYMTYGDLRTIKYCIKVKASGLEGDSINNPSYNVARVQCYKVVEGANGVNTLVESAPQDDIAVYVHAEGKIVKVVLFGGETDDDAIAKQRQHDEKVPTRDGKNDYIPGSCFLVHDDRFGNAGTLHREEWFYNPDDDRYPEDQKEEIKLHQINYTDTFWLTDLYVFQSYDQTYFSRDGYSAWAWPRLNSKYTTDNGSIAPDSTLVNTILGVEPITIIDTSMTAADLEKQQKTFDIYLGDTGFKIDEQNDFGEMVFVVAGTVKVSILDGLLAGREFEVNGAVTDSQFSCICAYNDDGSTNDEFFKSSDYSGDEVPRKAFNNGAIWRLRLNRINLDEPDYSNLNIALPNTQINAKNGDHLVLLDIFMPDIYIHAAENRLLREAEKYLYANDNGSVNYAVTFDKVRMHQIPMYGLQMREGLNIRMVDEDLDMRTKNDGRYIIDYKDKPLVTSKDVDFVERNWQYTLDYVSAKAILDDKLSELIVEVVLRYEENWLYNPIRIVQGGVNYDLGRPIRTKSTGWSEDKGGYVHLIYYKQPSNIDFNADYTIYRNQIIEGEHTNTWLSSSQAIDFTRGNYYTVNLRVKDNGYVNPDKDSFLLLQTRDDITTSYKPSDSVVSYHRKDGDYYLYISISFHLEDSFNDNTLYYPSLLYTSDGREVHVAIHLISVQERDYDSNENILPYADFTVDSVTTKIYDSSSQAISRPVREISATLSEQHNATAWASLVNRVENTEKESEHNKLIYQEMVLTARRHYQTLLNLRNSIFDPDGTCDQTFLQVMMMQVGADSMNYQLRNTRTGLNTNGELDLFNCSCKKESDGYFHFVVNKADTLDHYVFTDGEHHGTWEIPNGINAALYPDGDGVCQPYFISIRCPRNGGDAQWVCETKQRKLNEDATCWYFNWGILTCDSAGVYTLTETRGNAYMYGDNIVAGKISSLAKNSWFDLTNGEFVLGNTDSGAAFSYIDGVLHIGGLPTDSDVADLLIQLGVINDKINNIGGENLLPQSSYHYKYQEGNILALTYLMPLEAGKTYICTYGKSEDNATSDEEWARGFCLAVSQVGNVETIEKVVRFGEPFEVNSNGRYLYIAWGVYEYVNYVKGHTPSETTVNRFVQYLDQVMVQEGEIATNFQPSISEIITPINDELDSYKYLKKALEADTDFVGGLVATSQIHLREWTGKYVDSEGKEYPDDADGRTKQYKYTAGISGIDNSNPNGEYGDGTYSDGVSFFAGGEYDKALEQAKGLLELAKQLPILLTKTGIHSKIGCLEVTSPTEVTIFGKDNTKIVIDGGDNIAPSISMLYNDEVYLKLSADSLASDVIETKTIESFSPSVTLVDKKGISVGSVDIDTINFAKAKYTVSKESGTNIRAKIRILLDTSFEVELKEFRLSFDIFIGKSKFYTFSIYDDSVTAQSGISDVKNIYGSCQYNSRLKFTGGGDKTVSIRNISASSSIKFGVHLLELTIGTGDNKDEWKDGSLMLTSDSSQFTMIGRNGMQLSSTSGLVQILTDNTNAYVQMQGLPPSDPHKQGQLWKDDDIIKISKG